MNTEITNELTSSLYTRIAETIEAARRHVAQTANLAMVTCYYQIGRMIVEDEQKGKHRAEYGEKTLQALSERLTERFGKGFSYRNLRLFRQFYQTYSSSIGNGKSAIAKFQQKFLKVTNETPLQFRFRIAALRLHAQKLQDIRLLQDILRLRDDVAFAGQLHDGILVLAQGDALIQRTADLPVQPPHAPVPLRRLDLIEAARQGVLNT